MDSSGVVFRLRMHRNTAQSQVRSTTKKDLGSRDAFKKFDCTKRMVRIHGQDDGRRPVKKRMVVNFQQLLS